MSDIGNRAWSSIMSSLGTIIGGSIGNSIEYCIGSPD